jgi:hypothetical protein
MRTFEAASLALIVLAAGADAQLLPAERIATGSSATFRVTLGDADGDGLADLVTQGGAGGTLLLRGTDAGTLLPPLLIEGAPWGTWTGTADINGDGRPDLVSTDINRLTVQLGLGGLQFGPPVHTALDSLTFEGAFGDFDGDGRADALVDPFFAPQNTIGVAFAEPDGTFVLSSQLVSGHYEQREAHDIDGDGALDIVGVLRAGSGGKLRTGVLLGSGSGAFGFPVKSGVFDGLVPSSSDMAVADLDADGAPDMAIVVEDAFVPPVLVIARGLGNGTFATAATLPLPPEGRSIAAGDMNGDGRPDLVLAGSLADANGSAGAVHTWLNAGDLQFSRQPSALVGGIPDSLVLVDADGDGVRDAILGHAPFVLVFTPPAPGDAGASSSLTMQVTDLSLVHGRGDGSFASATQVLAGAPVQATLLADADGDGVLDLLLAGQNEPPRLQFAAGAGDGSFGPALDVPGVAPTEQVAAADLDGDARLDLVLEAVDGTSTALVALRGTGVSDATGAPTFASPVVLAGPGQPHIDALAIADLDADGAPDVVVLRGLLGALAVHRGAGDGSFLPPTSWPCDPQATALAVADVTADGRADLLLGSATDDRLAVLVAHAGGFLPPVHTPLPGPRDKLALADLDADGFADAVLASGTSPALTQLRGLGNGAFVPFAGGVTTAINPSAALLLEDLTGDGRRDLLAVHLASKALCVRTGAEGGGFGAPQYFYTRAAPSSAAVADLDGDGLRDVCIGAYDSSVWVLRNELGAWTDLGGALAASWGTPQLMAHGALVAETEVSMLASGVPTPALGALILGFGIGQLPYAGGVLVPRPDLALELQAGVALADTWPAGVAPGLDVCVQAWFASAGASGLELGASRALLAHTP